jgi:glucose-1-phosphate thymidylyltransferase
MIYYPLSVLMQAGIKDVLVITTPQDQSGFKQLLGDGSNFGISLEYAVQPSPDGLAQAFIIANDCGFLADDEPCAMVLGDNIFHGTGFAKKLRAAKAMVTDYDKAVVFGTEVDDPFRYGIAEVDELGNVLSIEEKPKEPKSNYAVTGLYFYPCGVSARANQVKPSARGELEITTLNEMYLNDGLLDVQLLGRGFAWLDTGTMSSLLQAANFVETIQSRQGIVISAPEEIAYVNGFIDKDKLAESAKTYGKSPYGEHLKAVAEGRVRY